MIWGWTAWRAYRSARARDFRAHQAWIPNLVVAELLLRARGLPALRLSTWPVPACNTADMIGESAT